MASPESINHSLTSLSQEISTKVAELSSLLSAGSHPIPSLKADSPSDYPNDEQVQVARLAIIDAASALVNLATGPREFVSGQVISLRATAAVMLCLYRFNIFNVVPLEGSISYSDIASKTGLSLDKTERIIKHAMTIRMFYEPEPGKVAHTANSIMPAKFPSLNMWIGLTETTGPALDKLSDAFENFGDSGEANETAVNLALGKTPEDTYWTILANDGEGEKKGWRMRNYGKAMGATRNPVLSRQLPDVTAFDWESLGKATVVDVGGGGGQVCIPLATYFPKIKFVVQDVSNQEPVFEERVPSELRPRISFETHDFFTPQPVKGADVYILSSCLHDWSDQASEKILLQLVSAMKPHSRILIIDGVMPEFGESSNARIHGTRSVDMLMLSIFNGKERTKENWKTLVEKVDPRLEIRQIKSVAANSPRHLIEVGFKAA